MESCSHPEIKDTSARFRCHLQQTRYPVNGYAKEYPFPHEKAPGLRCLNRRSGANGPRRLIETASIAADGSCFLERDAWFLKVAMAFVKDGDRLTRRIVLIAFRVCTSYMIGVLAISRQSRLRDKSSWIILMAA
jgi:hypothetical protein